MNRKIALGVALLLSACGPSREQIMSEYSSLSCDDIKNEYRQVLKYKVDAFNQRMKDNDMNLVVNSVLNVFSGHGETVYNAGSFSEEEAELRMDVLRKALYSKKCSNKVCKNCKGASL